MIHKVDETFCISSQQVWMPGAYADARTARYAFRFPDTLLRATQENLNPGGLITYEMLRLMRALTAEKETHEYSSGR